MGAKAFKKIMAGLEDALAHIKGEPNGVRVHYLPPGAVNVAELRSSLGLSQSEFARGFGVPVRTVQNWEQKRRQPRGAASVLLKIIRADPEHVIRMLWPEKAP